MSFLTRTPLPVALWRRAGAAARGLFRHSLPQLPPALLFLFLCVIFACRSFVTAIKLSHSFLPLLLAAFPSQVPLCTGSSHVPASRPLQVPERSPAQTGPVLLHYSIPAISLVSQPRLGHCSLWTGPSGPPLTHIALGDSWSLLPMASKAAAPLMSHRLICWPRVSQAGRVNVCTLPHSLLLKGKTLLHGFYYFFGPSWISWAHSVWVA